ncbi:uncharacterized protein DDB_G0283357-like [Ruditapes philippinarum]|uniref:uncharacterized protein DDB_G0283357-like n=1 Tax=Ruditapes philippinarum TaxID=129788 RepID=UPI00295C16C7|nr:uncharacterized protein DDB_G0283357-like [Ruditapes philippinarum]
MRTLHFVSIMLLLHNGKGQGMFDFFGFGGGMADPYGGAMVDPFMGGGGGMGGGFGAGPSAPIGPDPSLQDARLTMAEEQMAEVMGESPQSSPERQRIDRLIKQTGGQFMGDAAPLNYLVQEYLMTTPGPVPPPAPQPRQKRKQRKVKQRLGKMRNRNRQGGGQNNMNAPNMNIRPTGASMQPPAPKPTRPTGRMGNPAPYIPQRPQAPVNQAMNQGQMNQLPPANTNMYQNQAPTNTNNRAFKSQPQPYNQGFPAQPPTNNNQAFKSQPQPYNQGFPAQPPTNNNQAFKSQPQPYNQGFPAQPPTNNNQAFKSQPQPYNQGFPAQPPTNMNQAALKPTRKVFQGHSSNIQAPPAHQRQQNMNINQGNNHAPQGQQNNNNKAGTSKSTLGVAANRLKRIEGRINSVNSQLIQARQMNNMAQIADLQSQLEALNGVKQILTGGSAKSNEIKTIRGRANANTQVAPPQNKLQQNSAGPQQILRTNGPTQVPYGPPKNNNNMNNVKRKPTQVPYGPPHIGNNQNNVNNKQSQKSFGPPQISGVNNRNTQIQFGPPPMRRSNRNNFNNNPSNTNNFQERNVGGGKFAQTWRHKVSAPAKPPQSIQNPYPTANNGNAYNQGNTGLNNNHRKPPVNVNIQPYQNTGPGADPYATNNVANIQATAPYDAYPSASAPYDQRMSQQAATYDPYPSAQAPYDPGMGQQTAAYDPGMGQQAAAYDPGMGQQAAAYDPYPSVQPPYDPGMSQQTAAAYDPYPSAQPPYDSGMGQQAAPYSSQTLSYDPHAPAYQRDNLQQPMHDPYAPLGPGIGQQGMYANNAPAPNRRQQRRKQGRRRGGARRGGGRRAGARRGGANAPLATDAPIGTTVAPQLGDTKLIRGVEHIYTDADGYDTFQWIKKSLIPKSQLDHLPQAGQEQQGGQAAPAGEGAAQPA